ncbi:MAG: hypothetical protein QF609_08520 [Gammaproteobacteria bacterium]|jgi:hypothetical protein|nr:hypothetical protein [Gammaproteobacteria bacterium]
MKSIADMASMRPISDNSSTHEPAGATNAPLGSRDPGAVVRQAITLLRIVGVLLSLYLKFKFLLWFRRGADGARQQ